MNRDYTDNAPSPPLRTAGPPHSWRNEFRDAASSMLAALRLTRRHRKFHRDWKIIRASGLFDRRWYRERYGALVSWADDPIYHYLRCGAEIGCDPSADFDSSWYLRQYPDVAASGCNPLVHYIGLGAKEGRAPAGGPGKDPLLPTAPASRVRVVYLSGEPDTPGAIYRVGMQANLLGPRDFSVRVVRADEIGLHRPSILAADVLVAWRLEWTKKTGRLLARHKSSGGKLVFDIDDYFFEPRIASREFMDGLRSQGMSEEAMGGLFQRVRRTMLQADFCTAPTRTLADLMGGFHKPVEVVPNGFNEETFLRSRNAVAARRPDGLVRIGYAGGTRTHQKDFARASSALAQILRKHPRARLVLFHAKSAEAETPCLDIGEFPELRGLESKIEWRQMVPLRNLPDELARFDINLAPLETGNIYCEAKSELKFFEAALVEVPTVASPTAPLQAAIAHGKTGFLADSGQEWLECLDRLVEQKDLRDKVGRCAFHDVLPRYGPERRSALVRSVILRVLRGETGESSGGKLATLEPDLPI